MTTSTIQVTTDTYTSITVMMKFTGTGGDTADGASVAIYPSYSSSSPLDSDSNTFTETTSKTQYFTFSGLENGTTYYLEGAFTLDGGFDAIYNTGRISEQTDTYPSPSIDIYSLGKTETSIQVESTFSSSYYQTDGVRFYIYEGSTELTNSYLSLSDRSSSTNGATFVSLDPSTTYKCRVRYYDAGSISSWYEDTFITTDSPPAPTVNIYESSVGVDEVRIRGYFSSGGYDTDGVRFYIYDANTNLITSQYYSLSNVGYANEYHTFTGLSPNTQYRFMVRFYDANSTSYWNSVYIDRTTLSPSRPTITIGSGGVTQNSISVDSSFSSNYYYTDEVRFYIYHPDNYSVSIEEGSTTFSSTQNSTNGVTFGGLEPDVNYKVGVRYYNANSTTGSWYEYTYISTDAIQRPSNWSWFTTKSSGVSFNVTASEWNTFTNKINEFRGYKGLSGFNFTNAYTGNVFFATLFNQARDKINDMNPSTSVPSSKVSGDTVTAYDLNRLRDSLNSIT